MTAMKWIVLLLVTISLADCSCGEDKLAGAVSPDGRVIALLSRINGGATFPFYYTVHLLTSAVNKPVKTNLIFYVADLNCISISWENDRAIKIAYAGGASIVTMAELKGSAADSSIKVSQSARDDCGIDIANRKQVIYAPR